MRERQNYHAENGSRMDNGQEMVTVGKRLRGWRKSSSMKLVELSSKIHVSQGSLSDLENDKSLPSATTLANLCLYADINIYWLLTGMGPVLRSDEVLGDAASRPSEDMDAMPALRDQKMREMVERFIRVCLHGDPQKKAHLEGFLAGADPAMNLGGQRAADIGKN